MKQVYTRKKVNRVLPTGFELKTFRLLISMLYYCATGDWWELDPGGGGGVLSYERGGDARRLAFGFWSHLGCSGKNAIIFSRDGLV